MNGSVLASSKVLLQRLEIYEHDRVRKILLRVPHLKVPPKLQSVLLDRLQWDGRFRVYGSVQQLSLSCRALTERTPCQSVHVWNLTT